MAGENLVTGQRVDSDHLRRAKELRRWMTPEEKLVWERVRRNGLAGFHVRRQQVIDGFIVDFYCHAARLVIELDGGIHAGQQADDGERDLVLGARGLQVLRVRNEEIVQDVDGVLERISMVARERAKRGTGAARPT